MNILIIREPATREQIDLMMQKLRTYIKLAVDVEREILAGGGELHADCEQALLYDGSQQRNLWGADWLPDKREVRYEALINIRPTQNNYSMEIRSPALREEVNVIVRRLLEVND